MTFFDKVPLRLIAGALYLLLAATTLFSGTATFWQRLGNLLFLTVIMGSAFLSGVESTEKDLSALNERITNLEDSVEEKA